ncbi:PREDICTED: pre-mRNA-splicing factor CWC25 homolog [Lepidothrix coronata]|uniref:Pre-mRNA-splicing factor CWC25 homolog n=1 Tax=Lepidothrix coronata TaxID=321398 RepID=A0A6J0J2Z7_9PASS|nr:PREDICTED: pre-mRNA-splicing factor CWC25 homolog [Lepidothrix coronata]
MRGGSRRNREGLQGSPCAPWAQPPCPSPCALGANPNPVPACPQNLKKSWHPQTLRNVEKVWKAEQKHEAERRKIEELQRELQEERAREEMQRYAEDMGTLRKREEKLEWMYQGPGGMVNREEYLMGRPVDKFIFEKAEDKEAGCSSETGLLPGSIFAKSGANSVLDMANKIREDPLFMIRCWEGAPGRGVLAGSWAVGLRNTAGTRVNRNLGRDINKPQPHVHPSLCSSWLRSPLGPSTVLLRDPSELQVRDSEQSHRSRSSPGPGQDRAPHRHRDRSRSSSRSPQRHSSKRNSEQSGSRGSGSPSKHSKQHSSREEKGRARSPSPKKSYRRQHPPGYTRKLSPEELERKRQEMMENAKWREEERANNLRKHRKEEELERELEKLDARDGKFFHRLKLESASTSTLEDRVKRNIHSLQRTPAALEKNFMQR